MELIDNKSKLLGDDLHKEVKQGAKLKNKLDFQISKTESAIAYETQSKKRFEYNARLKQYREEREKLLEEGL